MKNFGSLLILIVFGCAQQPESDRLDADGMDYTQYVDPFIGTGGHGHTFPGATLPNGMVQPSPDNGISAWDWCSGYHYSDSIIVGFSQTHLSGTGIGDLADVLLMPTSNQVDLTKRIESRMDYDYKSSYSHDDEEASPGYYTVYLPDNRVRVSLTSSLRTAMHQYQFDDMQTSSVVLDLSYRVNWDNPTRTHIKIVNDTTVIGIRNSTGWARDQRVFFTIRFSEPFTGYQLVEGEEKVGGIETMGIASKSIFSFENLPDKKLLLKVGISTVSNQGSTKALEEISTWDFEQTRRKAKTAWNDVLRRIEVKTEDARLKRIFYTALYHTQVAPITYSDAFNEYKGADSLVHKAGDYTKYSIFSLWDTFRAAHPLYTIINEDQVADFINSMLAHFDEYGLLPVWELVGNETNTMTGYHAVPVIVDAYFKGITGFDVEKAYEAIKASGMQDIRGVNFYKEYGYIPADLENESVTKNLEYAFDDWCIARMARDLGKEEDYEYFRKRSESYKLLYDPETKFMRGKLADGSWKTPFDPKYSSHRVNAEYTEGNAWQHSWFVPHDVKGLIELMGGNEAFTTHLDALFNEDSEITGDNVSVDISGLIGQYAHGNEPSHHIAYLYNYAGKPWKTQETARTIMDTMYDDKPDGLSGNEDCGQMSAWYIFSAMGLYPTNPASGIYDFGSPVFEKATINLPNGKQFVIEANNVSEENIYVGNASLDGQAYTDTFITHEILMQGGRLQFEMSSVPNTN